MPVLGWGVAGEVFAVVMGGAIGPKMAFIAAAIVGVARNIWF